MRRDLVATLFAALIVATAAGAALAAAPLSAVRQPTAVADLKVVFAALDRRTDHSVGGLQQIYTANGDGTGVTRITSDDGYFYDWPVWAFNGTKIVYTARKGERPGGEEAIWMMDPDGSHRVKLSANLWRNAQPKVSPDGRWLVFASVWEETPELAIYRMDLTTLQVENLTARGGGTYSFESDPNIAADGASIVFAYSGGRLGEAKTSGTQIWTMKFDGTDARALTADTYYNTDPMVSPDGRLVAISSYRGAGVPRHAWPPQSAGDIFLQDWRLVLRDTTTGAERELTRGERCADAAFPCAADRGPAWVPKWSPDGKHVGYLTVRSPVDSGIAVVGADGSGARPLIELASKSITWWDWTDGAVTAPRDAVDRIGSAAPPARLLFSAAVYGADEGSSSSSLYASTADRWIAAPVTPARGDLAPIKARWTRDRSHIVFTARVPVDRSAPAPAPPPPPGEDRRVHFTFAELDSIAGSLETARAAGDVAQEQIFMMAADGSDVRQLTTPWTEDYLDAIPPGDARGNTDPDVSPDGRYLIFTNVSSLTQESFILRMDLGTGEVINLTNMTSGAVPVADAEARFSPDGRTIALRSSFVGGSQIYLMNVDGTDLRAITDDVHANVGPAWSPDGRWLVYASYRGGASVLGSEEPTPAQGLPLKDWYAVAVEVASGAARVVAGGDQLVLRPAWSPDGRQIAFISVGPTGQPDIYVVDRDGGLPHPLQMTIRSKEAFFDWR